jgi:hydrogenase maturation protein HypF
MRDPDKSILVTVTGLVQGVGFRPFVYRLATHYHLTGWVRNTNKNVRIKIEGSSYNIDLFLISLKDLAPPAARIEDITLEPVPMDYSGSFKILESENISGDITGISPDIAVCEDCLNDMESDGNRRDYAFVNCTNCGPRFTIIKDLPYDRAKTTMQSFELCEDCRKEFEDIRDRRFHAQPVACNLCGPQYEMIVDGKKISGDSKSILLRISSILEYDGILAIKGLGGMHLACNPFSDRAVEKLRKIKYREGKPFALMFRDVESVKLFAQVTAEEEKSLVSWRRPIVLLEQKPALTTRVKDQPGKKQYTLSKNINSGLSTIGVMLPYMPFHYLFFRHLRIPAVVLTSGNFSNEPIIIDNQAAIEQFSRVADIIVLHNRDIENRTDDSVVRISNGRERVFRRSRGYVPTPVPTGMDVDGIIGFGAELTNCFCVGKGNKAILSQHIGDLQGMETTAFYEKTIAQFVHLFRIKPTLLAVDMHPDYISGKTARKFGDFPIVQVQHHHAHVASCMAEHRLDEKVIGVALDGTGYGSDGNIWGAEFLVCDLQDFRRITHFDYVPLPGGDVATEEPWRMAVSYLYRLFGPSLVNLELPFLKQVDPEKVEFLIKMIEKKVNCPLVSSTGRLFDAVSAMLNLCHIAGFPAEGPMRLESIVQSGIHEKYGYQKKNTIQFDSTFHEIIEDIQHGTGAGKISAKFHNTIISVIFDSVKDIRDQEGIDKVVLSGGVFQNKYLLTGVESILEESGFRVYSHSSIPANDGGIALGQLVIAAKRREMRCV